MNKCLSFDFVSYNWPIKRKEMIKNKDVQQEMFKKHCTLQAELRKVENTIDKLETFCLKKGLSGNVYLPEHRSDKSQKKQVDIVPPPYTKLFSLSSCTSIPFLKLKQPYSPIIVDILDNQGNRKTSFGGNLYPKKHKKTDKQPKSEQND